MYFNPNKLIEQLAKNTLSEKRIVIYLFIFVSFVKHALIFYASLTAQTVI